MPLAVPPELQLEFDRQLTLAKECLEKGDSQASQSAALSVYRQAEQAGSTLYKAMALDAAAHADRLASRFASAYEASSRAASLFNDLGLPALEGQALATFAHTASTLARNEEAQEAGRLSVKVLSEAGPSPMLACAHNNLGVALFWSRQFGEAQEQFSEAVAVAERCTPQASAFQPLFNRVWAETYRLVCERNETGTLPCVKQRRHYLEACRPFVQAKVLCGLVSGLFISMHAMWHLAESLQVCWEGEPARSADVLDVARGWARRYDTTTWLNALETWAAVEIQLMTKNPEGAKQELRNLREVTKKLEHEQLSLMTYSLGAYLAEAEGRWDDSLLELKNLRALRQRIRRESQLSAGRLKEWRAREGGPAAASVQFESIAVFTASGLDGLSESSEFRSTVDRALAQVSQGGEAWPLLEVVILNLADLEAEYSGFVADEVTRTVGELLARAMEGEAMLTQLTRSRFVLLFGETGSTAATESAQAELQRRMQSIDWNLVHPGLSVLLSSRIGSLGPTEAAKLGGVGEGAGLFSSCALG